MLCCVGIDECEDNVRRAYDDRDQCEGGLQFLLDCEQHQTEKYFVSADRHQPMQHNHPWHSNTLIGQEGC